MDLGLAIESAGTDEEYIQASTRGFVGGALRVPTCEVNCPRGSVISPCVDKEACCQESSEMLCPPISVAPTCPVKGREATISITCGNVDSIGHVEQAKVIEQRKKGNPVRLVCGRVEVVQAVGLSSKVKVEALVSAREERVLRGGVIDQVPGS